MNTQMNQQLLTALRKWSQIFGMALILLGCVVLVGWQFDVPALKGILPGLATMKANTSIGFLLAGLTLLLEHKIPTRLRFVTIRVFAGIVTLLGLLTLGEYLFSLNFGIDQMLFRDLQTPEEWYPGRMSITTAVNFSLLGIALLIVDLKTSWGVRMAQFLALIAGAIAAIALIGYLYGVESLYSVGAYSSMALHTALGFAALTLGVLFVRPQAGWMAIVSSEAIGGVVLRRLVLIAVFLPVVLGWFRLWGEREGFYDSHFGLALMVILSVASLSVVIWLNAGWLNRLEIERRQVESAFRGSESLKASILQSALDCIIMIDHQGRIIEFNPAAQMTFGYSLQEVLGKEIVQLIIPPALRERHRLGLERYLASGESKILEKRMEMPALRADGGQFPAELTITRLADSDPPVFAGFLRDITERKRAEQALYERERQMTALITSLDDVIFEFDQQGTYLNVWTADESMLAQPKTQLLGRRINEVLGEENGRSFSEAVQRVITSGHSEILEYSLEVLGGQRWFMARVSPINNQDINHPTASMLIRDITERKQAEEQLHYQAHLLAYVNDAIIASDANYILKAWNFAAEKMYGWSAEEVIGKDGVGVLQTEFPGADAEQMRSQIAEKGSFLGEATQVRKDGQRITVEIASIVLRDEAGQSTGYVSVNRDITDRKLAEEQYRFQANLVASVADAIVATDMQLNIQSWNAGAETMYGWQAEEVLGRPAKEILDTDFLENSREAVTKQILEQGHWRGEVLQLRRDGTKIPALSSVSLYKDSEGKPAGVVAVNRDITELKHAEDALRKNERNAHSLLRLSKRLERAQTYSEALGAALDEVKVVVGYQNVWTYLLSEDKQQLRLLTTTGGKSQDIADDFPTLNIQGDRFLEEIVEGGDIVIVEDARIDPRTNKEIVAQLGNRTIVNVPILLMEKRLGAFGTGSFGDEGVQVPTPAQLDYLRALASHMAVTLDRIHLLNKRRQVEERIRRLNEELEDRVAQRTAQLDLANRELEKGKREIQNIFDSMTTLNAKVALDGRLLLVNQIAAQASGLSSDELMKTNFLEGQWWAFDPEVQNRVKNAFWEACSGTSINYDEKIFVFGQVLTINFSLTPMLGNEGQIEYILAEARDITKLKEIEEALQAKTAQLEAANKELDAFSHSVSHDLRAPLRTIDGFSQALLDDYGQHIPADGHSYLERVRKSAGHMAELIDGLLNLSRMTRAPMREVSVDLSRLAQDIATDLQSAQPERRAKFRIEPNLKARGDRHLLQAVLQNLLSNAWKYTSKREQADIEFGSKQEGDETIYFIRDNGAGFDMAYASKLFGAFQRLHATAEFPGTGVGLVTVQRIIHRHGGRIWAEAEMDRGATFFFSLPGEGLGKPGVIPK